MFRYALVAAAILLVATTRLASALQLPQILCSNRADVVKHLADKYEEKPIFRGLTSTGGIIEIFSSQTSASWTIIITMPDGISCMIAAGKHWEKVPHSKISNTLQEVFRGNPEMNLIWEIEK